MHSAIGNDKTLERYATSLNVDLIKVFTLTLQFVRKRLSFDKLMIKIQHNIVKNPNWPEANQLAIYNRYRGLELWAWNKSR